MSAEGPAHHCPGCGQPQRRVDRYPWHFCQACLALATSPDGAPIRVGNAATSGGLSVQVAGGPWLEDIGRYEGRILGRPVLIREARFGGVVAEPLLR